MIIRPYALSDETSVVTIFRRAFAGPPWNENWSDQKVGELWQNHASRRGFTCVVAVVDDSIVAATWYDTPLLAELAQERGQELAAFARVQNVGGPVIWIRETVCDPAFQGRGLTGQMKECALGKIRADYNEGLLLTRMRDDNVGIVRINTKFGFQKTGIRVASQAFPGLNHDYWFLRL